MVPSLPSELIDQIIDFLWDDQVSLYNCSLTCRAWVLRSRCNLFSHMRLGRREAFDSLVRASTTPHIASAMKLVHTLVLSEGRSFTASKSLAWVYRLPLMLGHKFRNVKYLQLEATDWANVPVHRYAFSIGLPQLENVVRLELRYCMFRSFRQLQHLVYAFPRLRDIRLASVEWVKDVASPQTVYLSSISRPLLTDVSIVPLSTWPRTLVILDWLVCTASVQSLCRLELWIHPETAMSSGRLFSAVGTRLQILKIDLSYKLGLSDVALLNLHVLTALRTLDVGNESGIHLDEVLAHISSGNSIHTLELRLFLSAQDPQGIAKVLELHQFPALQKLVISACDLRRNESSEALQKIEGMANALRRRGLRVEVTNSVP